MAPDVSSKILEQLTINTSTLDTHIKSTKEWQDGCTKTMTSIKEDISGNGKLGLRIQVDRLEQTESKRGKFLWLVLGASITAIIMGAVATIVAQ